MLPEGIVSSGMPAVRATLAKLDLFLDPWQVDAASCILGKTEDGLYAADTVLLSIPRQVGKTFLVGALVFADCIVNPGTLVVWTAHRFKVSRETFDELKGLAMTPAMAPHVDPDEITTAAGNECIPFRNGSRIVFAARERGAIRGFRKVRRLVLDEAQILSEAAASDLAPTQNQAENPQLIMMGTPPRPQDPSETFTGLRDEALEGESEGTVYIEFSAAPGSDPDDRSAWREANPSLGTRTPERAIVRLRKILNNDDDFLREALGIWTDTSTSRVVDPKQWADLSVGNKPPVKPVLSVEVNPDRSRATIGAAWRVDDVAHVQIVEDRPGVDWVVGRVLELVGKLGVPTVVVDGQTAAASLIGDLEARNVAVVKLNSDSRATACASLYDAVTSGRLSHNGDPAIAKAITSARWKYGAEGKRAFARGESAADIAALYAVTFALHGLMVAPPPREFWGAIA